MTSICATILYYLYEVKNQVQMLVNRMKKNLWLLHLKFWPYFDRFICGLVFYFFWWSITERNLKIIYREDITCPARKKLTGKVVQKAGVITVRDVWVKVTKQAETEVQKAKKALDRVEAAVLKKKNARMTVQKKLQKQLHKELKVYLKVLPTLANLLKQYGLVICRCSQKIRFCGLWTVKQPFSVR